MPISDLYNSQFNNQVKTSTPAISSLYTPAPQVPVAPVSYHLPNRGATLTDADIEAFRPLLYGEVSNRNYDKKRLEGDVIFNTALNRQKEYARYGQNKTIAEILAMPNQYQAYGGPQYKEYASSTNPISAAKKKEVDAIVDEIKKKVQGGDFKDNTQGAYYYIHNPDTSITYDNAKPLFAK